MEYNILAETYEKLENISSKLSKADVLAELFSKTQPQDLLPVVYLISGKVFPQFSQLELGIATQLMIKAIAKATGFPQEKVEENFKKTGDLGSTAENLVNSKKQVTLLKKQLTVDQVFKNLQDLAYMTGAGSQDRKLSLIAELLVSAKPKEARYIVRTILEVLRIGVAEGIIKDAIVFAFLLSGKETKEEKKRITEILEHAWNILPDYAEIARIAREKGIEGLEKVKIHLGKSVQVMLAEKAESIEEILKELGKAAIEFKYDGMRVQIHKKGGEFTIYTRRLENVTKQFPDLVELCKKGLKADECIVEGEVIGIDPKSGEPVPFQNLSQRIQRKYDIEKTIKEIPIQVNLFDMVYLDGKMLFDKKLPERRSVLESVVKAIPGKLQLARQLITDDVKKAEKFYKEALTEKQEGVMIKNLDSTYVFGRHVGGWYKIKPILETLDLVIVSAVWGEGKRSKWLSSYALACREPDTGKFLTCGMMGTGLSEEQFEEMTKILKSLMLSEKSKEVQLKPKIVVEVAFQEIQKSTNYDSGYALRFPKLVRIRAGDKGPEEADTVERVKSLYESQGKTG